MLTEPQLPAPQLPSDLIPTISSKLTGKLLQRFALVNKDSYRQSLFEPQYLKVLNILLVQEPEKKLQHWFDGCEVFRSPIGHMIRHKKTKSGRDKAYYINQLRNELKQKNIPNNELIRFALDDDTYLRLLAYKTITLQDLVDIPAVKQPFFQSPVIAYIMLQEYLTLDALKKLPDEHLALFNDKACKFLLKKYSLVGLVALVAQMPYAQAKRLKQEYLYSLMQTNDSAGEIQTILEWPAQSNNFLNDILNWCNSVYMPILDLPELKDETRLLLTPQLAQMIFEIYQANPEILNRSHEKTLERIFQGLKYGYFSTCEIIKATVQQCYYIAVFMKQKIPFSEIKHLLACDDKELGLLGVAINKHPSYWKQLHNQQIFIVDIINQQLKSSAAAQFRKFVP